MEKELANYQIMRAVATSKNVRNKKARKKYFSWWKAELKKFVKDAQDMIKDAEKEEKK